VINHYETGDLGLSPRGAGHFLKNNGNVPADVLVVFNSPRNTGIDLPWFLGR